MEFLHPALGFASLAIATALALLCLWFGAWRRRRVLTAWLPGPGGTSAQTDVSPRKRTWRSGLLIAALVLVGLALAHPGLVTKAPVAPVSGDVILLVDCSRSMRATDVSPDRFTVAVQLAKALVRQAPADRFGLVAFAGEAFGECPLTRDREAVLRYLDRLTCDSIPLPGTDLNQALAECDRMLGARREVPAALILFSDGEQTLDAKSLPTLPAGCRLLAVGVGNPDLASPIPTDQGPLLDAQTGQPVTSRPDFAALGRLATIFIAANDGVEDIARQWLGDCFAGQAAVAKVEPTRVEWYPWLVLAALLCLCARWVLDERRVVGALALLAALTTLGSPEETYRQGLSLLQKQSFSEAVILWRQLLQEPETSPKFQVAARLNLGVAQHGLGRQLALEPRNRARALAAYTEAETCYRACLWDEDQSPRATRNLARLAQDRAQLSPPPEPEPPPASAQPDTPKDGPEQQASTGTGGSGEGGSKNQAPAPVPAEKELSPGEAAAAVQAMRNQEGDFNDVLRQKAARNWRTLPPARPW